MPHKVRLTPAAAADLQSIGDYMAAQHTPDVARRFIQSLRQQVASLRNFPERHHRAPEAVAAGVDLRQLVHGKYRVLYTIEPATVTIHGIRHGARRPLRRLTPAFTSRKGRLYRLSRQRAPRHRSACHVSCLSRGNPADPLAGANVAAT